MANSSRGRAHLLVVVGLISFLLSGCAAVAGVIDASPDLSKVVVADLDAADAIAVAHGDQIGHLCYPALKTYLGTATPTPEQVKGLISGFEHARVLRKSVEGGIPDSLKIACAPLLQDERDFLLKLGVLIGGAVK